MSRSRMTAGKRIVQEKKREKAQAKQERRAARRLEGPELSTAVVETSESDLIAELAAIHRAAETAEISPEVFEQRREGIRLQLEHIQRP